jgi:MFS family permease
MRANRLMPVLYLTMGMFGIQLAMTLDASQFQVMLAQEIDEAQLIGWVLGLGPLAGIVVQPLVGMYGDVLERKGLSRRRLMQGGLWVAVASTVALAVPLPLWAMIGLMGLFFFSFNVLMVSYRAVVTATSNRRALMHQKGAISGFFALFSGAGSFLMFLACMIWGGTPWPFALGAALLLLTFWGYFHWAPQPKSTQTTPADATTPYSLLFRPWNLLFYALPMVALVPAWERRISPTVHQRAIFRLFLVVFFAWFGIEALRGFFVLFAEQGLGLTQPDANLLLAILTLVIVAVSLPFGKGADRWGTERLLRFALIGFAAVCLAALGLVSDLYTAGLMSVLLGVCFSGLIVFPLSQLFKLCPPGEEGTYSGLYNLFISVPQLYSLVFTGWLIDATHNYRVILVVGAVSVILGAAIAWRWMGQLRGEIAKIPEQPRP